MKNFLRKFVLSGFRKIFFLVFLSITIAVSFAYYYLSPEFVTLGYTSIQPVAFSHKTHCDRAELDCMFCHKSASTSASAGFPTTQNCYSCHQTILADSENVRSIIEAYKNGRSLVWTRVVDSPDSVKFPHDIHFAKGVSCQECHGNIKNMTVTSCENYTGMKFCISCHRNPSSRLVSVGNETKGGDYDSTRGKDLNPPTDCSSCHN